MYTYKSDFAKLFIVDTYIWMAASVCLPFINAYYTQKEISPFEIGVLGAIGPIMAFTIQPVWAWLSDRTGKRRLVLQLITLVSAAAFLLYLVGETFLVFCIATIILMAFNSAMMPLNDAIITKAAMEKNVNFAIVRMGGTVGFAIVVVFIGGYLRSDPPRMFWLACFAYIGYALICLFLPKDKRSGLKGAKSEQVKASEKQSGRSASEEGAGKQSEALEAKKGDLEKRSRNPVAKEGGSKQGKRIFKTKTIVFVMVIAFIMQFALSFHGAFMSVYVVMLGKDQSMIGILFCISAFSEVPVLFVIQKLIKRFNTMNLLFFASFLVALRIIFVPLAEVGGLACIIISQVLQGPTYMISYYGCVTYISENVIEGKMSQGQSMLVMIQGGIASICGSLIGGAISDLFGLVMAFMIMAAFTIFATTGSLIGYRVFKRKHPEEMVQSTLPDAPLNRQQTSGTLEHEQSGERQEPDNIDG